MISVILPAYNEAENISKTITETIAFFEDCEFPYEIIIVNNTPKMDSCQETCYMAFGFSSLNQFNVFKVDGAIVSLVLIYVHPIFFLNPFIFSFKLFITSNPHSILSRVSSNKVSQYGNALIGN